MRSGVIAKKIGMTRFFAQDGRAVPITVLKLEDCIVTQIRQHQDKTNVQVGSTEVQPHRLTKPMRGVFAKRELSPRKHLREFTVSSSEVPEVGSALKATHFAAGQKVDVVGTSIGKGFAGGMKRWGFAGLPASHGVSAVHRSLGSTGNRQDPGKTFKNKKMAGHMGNRRVSTLNLTVYNVDEEKDLIYIHGSVPGAKGSLVLVRDAIKKKS